MKERERQRECGTAKSFPSTSQQTSRREIFMFPEEQKLKKNPECVELQSTEKEMRRVDSLAGHVKWTMLSRVAEKFVLTCAGKSGHPEEAKIKMKLRIFYSRRPGSSPKGISLWTLGCVCCRLFSLSLSFSSLFEFMLKPTFLFHISELRPTTGGRRTQRNETHELLICLFTCF